MSNTFHGSEHIKPQLIKRRIRRNTDNPQFDIDESYAIAYFLTKELLQKIQKRVAAGFLFTARCHELMRGATHNDELNLENLENKNPNNE